MICVIKALFASLAMWLISTNLVGMVVRGVLFRPPEVDAPTDRVAAFINDEARTAKGSNAVLTLFSIAAAAGYIYSLAHFWNPIVASAGVVFMLTRLPDLLLEIRMGSSFRRGDKIPRSTLGSIMIFVDLAAIPLVWYALCGMPT